MTDPIEQTNIVYVNRSDRKTKQWLHFKHTHPFSEIFCITGGTGSFLINDMETKVKKNDLVYISPQAEHTEISDYETPLEYFVIGISGFEIVHDSKPEIPYFKFNDNKREYTYYFYLSYEEFTYPRLNSVRILNNLVQTLFLIIEREQKITITAGRERKIDDDPAIQVIRHYIDINFKDELSLDKLATYFHMNKYHLSHRFKKSFGISPMKYWSNVKIENVKQLLALSNYSIIEIASLTGFSSQSYLSQTFKKETGMTPAEYRKNYRIK
ncbi:AraC family transcriptional regulator [Muricomes intestini]|uniref:AraC family transcriptional regulator n=1 Tax=Muricomes intestini TaxID=1796634 RepID=UPI002FDEB4F1